MDKIFESLWRITMEYTLNKLTLVRVVSTMRDTRESRRSAESGIVRRLPGEAEILGGTGLGREAP